MNPRERIVRTVNHELADHVSLKISPRDEVRRELLAHFRSDDWREVERQLGVEGWAGAGVGIRWDEWAAREDLETRPGDWPGSSGKPASGPKARAIICDALASGMATVSRAMTKASSNDPAMVKIQPATASQP